MGQDDEYPCECGDLGGAPNNARMCTSHYIVSRYSSHIHGSVEAGLTILLITFTILITHGKKPKGKNMYEWPNVRQKLMVIVREIFK